MQKMTSLKMYKATIDVTRSNVQLSFKHIVITNMSSKYETETRQH